MDTSCLLCHMRRYLDVARQHGTEEQTMEFARELMKMYLGGPKDVASTWFAPQVADLLHQHYGLPVDRLAGEKEESNRFVLERLELLRQKVSEAEDPVLTGLRLSIVGNYLDFSALQGKISFQEFAAMLDRLDEMQLDAQTLDRFRRELSGKKKLLYLTDNAGEIGFDRIFAEALARQYPDLSIVFCVRGGPVLNDATREDAAQMGIPFPVIDNGNRVAGTELRLLSDEAREALREADVIFAKGMANAETLMGCGMNVYYAFLVKCERFANLMHAPLMTPILAAERA